ncbi:simple sugar transport system permease protein [Amaricoccus macauensis]|uniref:Simple sugar transport system permease protein n=1 Tax=Amaricoccus macauensis TaxID=57001 RepID=A0A840SRK5_9RHOB|nr:ABC transporter permease [Amaricoccus macauensis]MBB5223400.1 simple sugar transport system permease protein [Amaricoccus macauensis]
MSQLPKWADSFLVPLLSVLLALVVSGLVVLAIGENPLTAVRVMITGAFGSTYNLGFTLFYFTNFVFTGLAVAVAFHAAQFNIGGEGQATFAGIGAALIGLSLGETHWLLVLPLGILVAFLFGAAWAAVPAYLQVRRGSHIVITTIMFNYIAAGLLVALLGNFLKPAGSAAPQSRTFDEGAHLPRLDEVLGWIGIEAQRMEGNIMFFFALAACAVVWLLLWRTHLGFEIRAYGHNEKAADYAGISGFRIVMLVMLLSGGLAGLMATNTVLGQQHSLVLGFVEGAGFTGIAVALMGRSHPFGVALAALLFGALYQGGAELAFEMPAIPSKMIVIIQALIILFVGAMENIVRIPLARIFMFVQQSRKA